LALAYKYPSNWSPKSNLTSGFVEFKAPAESFLSSTVPVARFSITPLVNNGTTADVVNARISESHAALKDFHIVEKQNTTLSGNPAQKIVYTWTNQSQFIL